VKTHSLFYLLEFDTAQWICYKVFVWKLSLTSTHQCDNSSISFEQCFKPTNYFDRKLQVRFSLWFI